MVGLMRVGYGFITGQQGNKSVEIITVTRYKCLHMVATRYCKRSWEHDLSV